MFLVCSKFLYRPGPIRNELRLVLGEARRVARERFLGIKTLQAIGSLKRQLLEAGINPDS